jgi:hypothetical protein
VSTGGSTDRVGGGKLIWRALFAGDGFRNVSPSISITWAWWSNRSIAALARSRSPNSGGHSSTARFEEHEVDREVLGPDLDGVLRADEAEVRPSSVMKRPRLRKMARWRSGSVDRDDELVVVVERVVVRGHAFADALESLGIEPHERDREPRP